MTTATASAATHTCVLKVSNNALSVKGPKGGTVTIPVNALDRDDVSSDEQGLVYSLMDAGIPGIEYNAELTIPEMKLLLALSQKLAPVTVAKMEDKVANAVYNHVNGKAESGSSLVTEERAITKRQNAAFAAGKVFMYLQYDIPTANKNLYNPSPVMWMFGFRMTESCWCVPQDQIDHPKLQQLFKLWDREGAKWFVAPFGDGALASLQQKAQEELDGEIRRQHASLIQRLASAHKRWEEARKEMDEKGIRGEEVTEKEITGAEVKHDCEVRSILQGAAKSLNAAIKCAENFDLTEEVSELIAAVKMALQSEAQSFNAIAKTKGIKPATV